VSFRSVHATVCYLLARLLFSSFVSTFPIIRFCTPAQLCRRSRFAQLFYTSLRWSKAQQNMNFAFGEGVTTERTGATLVPENIKRWRKPRRENASCRLKTCRLLWRWNKEACISLGKVYRIYYILFWGNKFISNETAPIWIARLKVAIYLLPNIFCATTGLRMFIQFHIFTDIRQGDPDRNFFRLNITANRKIRGAFFFSAPFGILNFAKKISKILVVTNVQSRRDANER
jgi:hypothetical protein